MTWRAFLSKIMESKPASKAVETAKRPALASAQRGSPWTSTWIHAWVIFPKWFRQIAAKKTLLGLTAASKFILCHPGGGGDQGLWVWRVGCWEENSQACLWERKVLWISWARCGGGGKGGGRDWCEWWWSWLATLEHFVSMELYLVTYDRCK